MSTTEILELFKADGIEILAVDGRLKVRAPTGALTNQHKKLITEHRSDLLTYLNPDEYHQYSGSLEQTAKGTGVTLQQTPPGPPKTDDASFKTYSLSNGQTTQLTKEEFDRVVEVYDLLLKQDAKLRQKGSAS